MRGHVNDVHFRGMMNGTTVTTIDTIHTFSVHIGLVIILILFCSGICSQSKPPNVHTKNLDVLV